MNLVQTVLILAVIPLAIYGLIAAFTLRGRSERPVRYRPGQDWDHEPVWWTANPAGVGAVAPSAPSQAVARTGKGGASGNW